MKSRCLVGLFVIAAVLIGPVPPISAGVAGAADAAIRAAESAPSAKPSLRPTLPEVTPALGGLDPVELVAGREVKGVDAHAVERGLYRYLFSSPANRQAFDADPERYAIQLGGACARMGLLTGLGSPDRHLVHGGRIYIFASDACRKTFSTDPEKFIERPDAPPSGSPQQLEAARALLDRAAEGFGGAATLDAMRSLWARFRIVHALNGGGTAEGSRQRWIVFPGSFREEESWNEWRGGSAMTPAGGFRIDGKHAWPMEPIERGFLARQFAREPLVIVRARHDQGLIAVRSGTATVGGASVEMVTVGLRGATTTLAIEPDSGRVLQAAWTGRGRRGPAKHRRTFSDFRKVGGLVLPHAEAVLLDGEPVTNPVTTIERIAVDEEIPAGTFEGPGLRPAAAARARAATSHTRGS